MRKQVFGRHLSRDKSSRAALVRSLLKALIASGKITTTKAKAKAISGEIDKIVGAAKEPNAVLAKRKVLAILANDRKITEVLFKAVAPAFGDRKSGFTKITYLPSRMGDKAKMARLEWSAEIKTEEPKKKEKKTKVKNAETKESKK